MKNDVADIVGLLDTEELIKMKKDLDRGGDDLNRLVSNKIKERVKREDSFCCVCHSSIDPYSVSNFTLSFGPEDMKKKAKFCGMDCMEHFLKNLRLFWEDENRIFVKRKKDYK